MMIFSLCWPMPIWVRKTASRADRAAPSMDLKKRLVFSQVMAVRASPMARPHSPPHRASRGVPPKKREKAAPATA